MSKCYVCKKELAKRCTGCLTISYCSRECQTQDWKYHRHSCKIQPKNVIDRLLFFNDTFLHIYTKIIEKLDGQAFHAMRCVNRRWRDLIQTLWQSKKDKKNFVDMLKKKWISGSARVNQMYRGNNGFGCSLVLDKGDLFVSVEALHRMSFLAIDTNGKNYPKIKSFVPKDIDKGVIFDVNKLFLVIYVEKKLLCFDRKTLEEIPNACEDLQIGKHSEGVQDWSAFKVKKHLDRPVRIKLFDEYGLILYNSGLVIKFRHSYWDEDYSNRFSGKYVKQVPFQIVDHFDTLKLWSRQISVLARVHFTFQAETGSKHHMEGFTTAYVFNATEIVCFNLEFDQIQDSLSDTKKLLNVYEKDGGFGSTDDRVMLTREKDAVIDEREYYLESLDKLEYSDDEDDDENEDEEYGNKGKYFQIWLPESNSTEAKPTIRLPGIQCAAMNEYCVALSASRNRRSHCIYLYSTERLMNEDTLWQVVPCLKKFPVQYECSNLLMSKEKMISCQWYEDLSNVYSWDFDEEDNEYIRLVEYNFWF